MSLAACLSLLTGAADAQAYNPSVPEPTLAGVAYGPHERNVMDLWLAEGDGPRPVVVFYHSGGWYEGSKERIHLSLNVQELLDAGISIAAANYRLIPRNPTTPDRIDTAAPPPVDKPLSDARRALQFVRHNAKKWNIDPKRVGVNGRSAGGCTSLWLAFHDDMADPDNEDPVLRQSTRVTCAAVGFAQTTLDPVQGRAWMPVLEYGGHAFGLANLDDAIAVRDQIEPWINRYSPAALVTRDDPPVYLIYRYPPTLGEHGGTHSTNYGAGLKALCAEAGVACLLKHREAKDVPYANMTAYLIARLKPQKDSGQ